MDQSEGRLVSGRPRGRTASTGGFAVTDVQSSVTVPPLTAACKGAGAAGTPPPLHAAEFCGVPSGNNTKSALLSLVSMSATRAHDAGDCMEFTRVPSANAHGKVPPSISLAATLSRMRPLGSTKATL